MDNISSSNDTKKPLLRTSKLGSLRPSLFQSSNSSGTENHDTIESINGDGCDSSATTTTAPDTAKLNPFLKCSDSDDETTTSVPTTNENSKDEKPDPLTLLSKNGLPKSNLFKSQPPSFSSSSSFVFGQNVHERVTGEQQPTTSSTVDLTNTEDKNDSDTSSSGLLFSSAVQKTPATTQNNETQCNSKSLQEAAREYEESRAQKRKFDEVETITGEEDENNVIEVINCKLFAFVASTYEERGRGCLRLNDPKKEGESSRVVFRTSGSLRVLLNTKIWSNMVAEKPSQKSLRLTAIDSNGQVKVFLIMARPDDVKRLHTLINHRINKEKRKEPLTDKNLNDENKAIVQPSQQSSNDDDWDINITETKTETVEEPSPKKKHVESQNEVQ